MANEIELKNGAATAGNADTSYTVPAQEKRKLLYGQVVLTTNATVANRRVKVQIRDASDNVIIDFHSGAVVAASQSNQHHEFMQGIYRETSFVGDALQVPIGHDLIMSAGWDVNVTIENGQAGDSYVPTFVWEKVR